jgi:hypothetical protein
MDVKLDRSHIEEHRLRVFENMVMKTDEMIRGWRKLHMPNEHFHNWYSLPNINGKTKLRKVR